MSIGDAPSQDGLFYIKSWQYAVGQSETFKGAPEAGSPMNWKSAILEKKKLSALFSQ